MRNCFIPGCDQLCKLHGTSKRKMFSIPKDKETLDIWREILPKQRVLKSHDKICERHFNEEDICTTYDNIVNGQLYKMERGRAKLNPKAIPSRNIGSIEKVPKRLKRTVLLTTKNNNQNEEMSHAISEVIASIAGEEQQLEVDGEIEVQDVSEMLLKESPGKVETVVAYEVSNEANHIEVSEEQIQELYESLYDDIFEVVLPNTLWGVHRCPERSSVFFSFVDPSLLRTTKVVSISCQGEIKILLGSRLVSEQNLIVDINSIESLSEMIAEMDEVQLCCRMFDNEFCEVSLKDSPSSNVCESCAQTEQLY